MTKPASSERVENTDAPYRPEDVADAFAILEALAGSVEAPADWAAEHDHYLYGTPKRGRAGV